MSKTAQRRTSAFSLGFYDGRRNYCKRWAKHPLMMIYLAGFHAGKAARKKAQKR